MTNAAYDLEGIRKHLLGDKPWFVYGRSYGGMLAQKYAILFPNQVSGLILDSTIHATNENKVARAQFEDLFIHHSSENSLNFAKAASKFPSLINQVKKTVFYISTGGFVARTLVLPKFLKGLANATNRFAAINFLKHYAYVPKPLTPMAKTIICREILDHPSENEESQHFFHPAKYRECTKSLFKKEPFDFSHELSFLNVKTMLWSGKFDPVTPNSSMQKIHRILRNSIFWENQHAGHVLFREKKECAEKILHAFLSEEDRLLQSLISSDACQSPPAFMPVKLL